MLHHRDLRHCPLFSWISHRLYLFLSYQAYTRSYPQDYFLSVSVLPRDAKAKRGSLLSTAVLRVRLSIRPFVTLVHCAKYFKYHQRFYNNNRIILFFFAAFTVSLKHWQGYYSFSVSKVLVGINSDSDVDSNAAVGVYCCYSFLFVCVCLFSARYRKNRKLHQTWHRNFPWWVLENPFILESNGQRSCHELQ